MSTVETLRAARALIADRKHWCQFHYAMDGDDAVTVGDPDADQFCALGALYRVTGVHPLQGVHGAKIYQPWLALKRALPAGFCAVASLNDGSTRGPRRFQRLVAHRAVIQMYDRAIQAEEASDDV